MPNRRVLLVTHGDERVGLGHVSRMLALAPALEGLGWAVYGWLPNPESLGAVRWRQAGRPVLHDGFWMAQAWDLAVVDMADGGCKMLERLRPMANKLVAVAPPSPRGRLVDWVIEQNETVAELFLVHLPPSPALPPQTGEGRGGLAVVSMGAADPYQMTDWVAGAVRSLMPVRVVRPENGSVPDLAEWLAQATVLVGAVGITALEACAAGVPSVLVSWTEDHARLGRWLEKQGAARHLGLWNEVTELHVQSAVRSVLDNHKRMSERGRQLVDGRGPERVAAKLRDLVNG